MLDQDNKKLNSVIDQYDTTLLAFINGKIHCRKRAEKDKVLHILTRFVDGVVLKNKKEIWTEEPNDLTHLQVEFFSYDQLVEAVLFAYAVGVENSVILFQEYPVVKTRLNLDELENSESTTEPEHENNGWLVVFRDVEKSNETLELAFSNANPAFVIAMQNKRWNNLSDIPEKENINYVMKFQKFWSQTQKKYQKREKKKAAYRNLKNFLKTPPHRNDVVFNTENYHFEIWNKQNNIFMEEKNGWRTN